MSRNLVNLLPPERIRAFRRAYFYRLVTTSLVLLAAVIGIHAILLTPSTILLRSEQEVLEREAARLESELVAGQAESANQELAVLQGEAQYLSRLSALPFASRAVRETLEIPRAGIRITGIAYVPPAGESASGKMTLTGVAFNRSSLQQYEEALSAMPGITAVDLPIGAYAKESNIDFTLTLSGTFKP